MNRRLLSSLIFIVVLAVAALGFTIGTGNTPSLGLDLQGGASVTLQPEGSYEPTALDVAVEIIRARVDSIGVAEPEIIRQGETVVINLPGVKDQQRALDIVGRSGNLQLRPVLQSGQVDPTAGGQTPEQPSSDTTVPEAGGPGESRGPRPMTDTTIPSDTTIVSETTIPSDTTVPADAGATSEESTTATPATEGGLPPGAEILLGRDGLAYVVGPVAATGLVFENTASATIQGSSWSVVVQLRGGAEGEDIWNALTTRCFSRDATCPTAQVAIVLDGEVISAPVVQEAVFTGGQVQITGDFSEQEARDLARILEFGAVPVQFAVSQVQTVSPTLGSDSLRAAIISGLVGLALVFLLMLAYYRFVAIIVFLGVMVSIALQFSIITYLSKTNGLALSLAGIAGIIVSIGIAVDSYIVFFERLKDELTSGRTLRNSAQRSFEGAWRTVLAADTVSFLAAGVLWWLTVGSVRGFAFFLGLATLADLAIVWFFTRPAMLLLARSKFMANRSMLGIKSSKPAEVVA